MCHIKKIDVENKYIRVCECKIILYTLTNYFWLVNEKLLIKGGLYLLQTVSKVNLMENREF